MFLKNIFIILLVLIFIPVMVFGTTSPISGTISSPNGSVYAWDIEGSVWRALSSTIDGAISLVSPISAYGDSPKKGNIISPKGALWLYDITSGYWRAGVCDENGALTSSGGGGGSLDTEEIILAIDNSTQEILLKADGSVDSTGEQTFNAGIISDTIKAKTSNGLSFQDYMGNEILCYYDSVNQLNIFKNIYMGGNNLGWANGSIVTLAPSGLKFSGSSSSDSYYYFGLATGTHRLRIQGATPFLEFGTDVTLYRYAADVLKTDDKFIAAGTIESEIALVAPSIFCGNIEATAGVNITSDINMGYDNEIKDAYTTIRFNTDYQNFDITNYASTNGGLGFRPRKSCSFSSFTGGLKESLCFNRKYNNGGSYTYSDINSGQPFIGTSSTFSGGLIRTVSRHGGTALYYQKAYALGSTIEINVVDSSFDISICGALFENNTGTARMAQLNRTFSIDTSGIELRYVINHDDFPITQPSRRSGEDLTAKFGRQYFQEETDGSDHFNIMFDSSSDTHEVMVASGGVASGIAPTSNTSNGFKGEIRITDSYIYICVSTNVWKRIELDGTAW